MDRHHRLRLGTGLLVALLILAVPGGDPGAEDVVSSRVSLYVDDDSTTIISPMLILQKDIFEETTLNLQYLADIESCASVDVVSTASPSRGYEETRNNLTFGVSHRIDLTSLGLGYAFSTENDYTSHAVTASLSREFFQRNFTAAVSAAYRWDMVGRVNDAFFERSLHGFTADLALTQILSRRAIGQFVYFFQFLDGYQANPYRLVPVADFSVSETLPDRRFRHSFTARVKESLAERWSAEQSFRFYLDSWGMTAETVLLQVYWQLLDPWTVRLRYRFHNQNKTDFYEEYYPFLQEYMTRDRELGSLLSHLAGPQVQWVLEDLWIFPQAVFDLKAEYFFIDYRDYALLESKQGMLVGAGINLNY